MSNAMYQTTKMDQQGRVYLPDVLRRRLGLKGAGGTLDFYINKDGDLAIRRKQT